MTKIILKKTTSAIFLATVLLAGTITLSSPSFMTNVSAQSESYYRMDNNNYKSQYGQDKYKTKDNVVVKKINCNNINVNVNGLELNGLPPFLGNLLASDGQEGYGGASSYGSGSYGDGGQSGYDKNNNSFKFVCINNNNNTVVVEEVPPPTLSSLTVKKQVFGCDNISGIPPSQVMNCRNLQNDSPEWLDCNNPAISGSIFCQSLPENLFDIEVLDDQGNQIQQLKAQNKEQQLRI